MKKPSEICSIYYAIYTTHQIDEIPPVIISLMTF